MLPKAKMWKGDDLQGTWEITVKLDGCCVIMQDGVAQSRAGKPLFNVPESLPDGTYECYLGSWSKTVSALRTQDSEQLLERKHFYLLYPPEQRIQAGHRENPTADQLNHILRVMRFEGYEGAVIRQGNKWLKLKTIETYDVSVVGVQPGKGKHEGRLGAIITDMGKVGTGFTDKMREELNDIEVGTVIEVSCMELTENGMFRHPRFVRVRFDK